MSNRVRLGLLGLNFGRHIADALTQAPAQQWINLVRVCDRDRDRARAVAEPKHLGVCFDLDEMLEDDSLDAIGVFTGPVGRAEMIRRVLRHGKHVVTTKPFELDPDAAMDVLNEAKRLGKTIHLNSPAPLLSPDLQQVLTWQQEIGLGRPIACRRDVWASYRETPDGTWQDDPRQCPVAPMFRLGIYMINDMIRLFGKVDSVQVTQSRLFTERPTADNAQLTLQFKSGAIGSIFASFCVDDGRPYGNSMVLNYERGTIYQNTLPCTAHPAERNSRMTLVTNDGTTGPFIRESMPDEASGNYQWEAFSRAVHGETLQGEVTPDQIVEGLRVIAAMSRASESGATERV